MEKLHQSGTDNLKKSRLLKQDGINMGTCAYHHQLASLNTVAWLKAVAVAVTKVTAICWLASWLQWNISAASYFQQIAGLCCIKPWFCWPPVLSEGQMETGTRTSCPPQNPPKQHMTYRKGVMKTKGKMPKENQEKIPGKRAQPQMEEQHMGWNCQMYLNLR